MKKWMAALLGGALGWLGSLPTADACSVAPAGWVQYLPPKQVWSNGVLVVHLSCSRDCEVEPTAPTITRTDDPSETPVPGTVIASTVNPNQRAIAWKPTNGFESKLYRGSWPANQHWLVPFEFAGIGVNAVLDPEHVALDVEFGVWSEWVGDPLCCRAHGDPNSGASCNPPGDYDACFFHPREKISIGTSIAIEPTLDIREASPSQYLNRVTWSGAPRVLEWSLLDPWHRFTEQAEKYCYVLELKSLIDGSEFAFPERCDEHPAGVTFGERDSARETAGSVGACFEPPPGWEVEWRAAQQAQRDEQCERGEPPCDGGCAVRGPAPRFGGIGVGSAWFAALAAVAVRRRRRRL